jgi:hypothetical protein
MLWSEVLQNWDNGIVLQYPKQLKGKFLWNTSVLKNNGNVVYKQSFITNKSLPEKQDQTDFQEYITKSKNKYGFSRPKINRKQIARMGQIKCIKWANNDSRQLAVR